MLSVKIIFLNLGLGKSYIWNAMPLSLEPPENFVIVVVGGCGGILMYISDLIFPTPKPCLGINMYLFIGMIFSVLVLYHVHGPLMNTIMS